MPVQVPAAYPRRARSPGGIAVLPQRAGRKRAHWLTGSLAHRPAVMPWRAGRKRQGTAALQNLAEAGGPPGSRQRLGVRWSSTALVGTVRQIQPAGGVIPHVGGNAGTGPRSISEACAKPRCHCGPAVARGKKAGSLAHWLTGSPSRCHAVARGAKAAGDCRTPKPRGGRRAAGVAPASWSAVVLHRFGRDRPANPTGGRGDPAPTADSPQAGEIQSGHQGHANRAATAHVALRRLATFSMWRRARAVQPVWWFAPRPRPVSAWKYS